MKICILVSVVAQSPNHVQLFETPWTAAHQACLSLTISQSLTKFMFIASVMPSSHLILWHPLFLLPSIFPSIRDFTSESSVHIRWPKYWRSSIIHLYILFLKFYRAGIWPTKVIPITSYNMGQPTDTFIISSFQNVSENNSPKMHAMVYKDILTTELG